MSTPTSETPRRGRPRDPRRDEAILAAAIDLVGEVGYDRMTIAQVSERAGVSKPTIYLRFPGGKSEIIAGAIEAHRSAQPDVPDTGSLRGDLVALTTLQVERLHHNAHVAAGLTCQLRESPELATVFREHIVTGERERVRAVLDRAQARGEIADAGAVTPLFAGVAPSLVHSRVLLTGEPVDQSFVGELVDRVLLPILHAT